MNQKPEPSEEATPCGRARNSPSARASAWRGPSSQPGGGLRQAVAAAPASPQTIRRACLLLPDFCIHHEKVCKENFIANIGLDRTEIEPSKMY